MKNKIITITFMILLGCLLVINIFIPTKDLSYSERRKLALFPKFTIEKVINGEFTKEFEDYTLDQFAFRNQFRSIKAFFDLKILNKKDNNEIYLVNDHAFKMEYPLDVNSIDKMSRKLNEIYDLYLQDMNVFYAIIPDKNYFRQGENTHLIMDYDKLESMLTGSVENMQYINIMDALELENYYKTDPHWKQEGLDKVLKVLGEEMDFKKDLRGTVYTQKTYAPFYGAYYGQSALNMKADLLTYQTNAIIENALVYNSENPGGKEAFSSVYDEDKLGKMDSYDVFLSGATPLLTVENPDNLAGKELIIFRDSFASSLAPLLVEEYSKITLVDLRYMRSEDLGDFVDFKDQDILFLYSTLVVNNSDVLK